MLSLMKGALNGTCLLVAAGVRAQTLQSQKAVYQNRGVADVVYTIEEEQKVIGSEKAGEITYKHAGIPDDGTTCPVTEGYYGETYTYQFDAWDGTVNQK